MATYVASEEVPAESRRLVVPLSGSLTEASGGAAAVILAILGLAHVLPATLLAISAIVVGGSLLAFVGVLASRLSSDPRAPATSPHEAVSEGMAATTLAGAAGVVLGIIALLGPDWTVFVPVAAIVYGATLLVANGTAARLDQLLHGGAIHIGPSPDLLIGFAAIVLGILALSGFAPLILSLVAMLALGMALMLKGAWFASSFASVLRPS